MVKQKRGHLSFTKDDFVDFRLRDIKSLNSRAAKLSNEAKKNFNFTFDMARGHYHRLEAKQLEAQSLVPVAFCHRDVVATRVLKVSGGLDLKVGWSAGVRRRGDGNFDWWLR